MIKNVLEAIGGIGIYGIVSLVIFFAFFSLMLLWAYRLKCGYLNEMGNLPLELKPESDHLNNDHE